MAYEAICYDAFCIDDYHNQLPGHTPQGRGGSNCVKNLQPLCGQNVPSKCNQRKGNTYSTSDK
jgi:hypothetical protein